MSQLNLGNWTVDKEKEIELRRVEKCLLLYVIRLKVTN